MKRWLLRLDDGVARMEALIASLALVLCLLVSVYTIAARALLIPTTEWVLEFPMELLVLAAIYGSGVLVHRNSHLQIDFLISRLSERPRRRLSIAVQMGMALLSAFLADRGAVAAVQAARADLRMTELYDLPSALPMATASVGFALWGLHYSLSMLRAGEGDGASYT